MSSPDPVLVFDLDGTVLRGNSFRRCVMFLIAGRMRGVPVRQRLAVSAQVQALLLRRKLARITHAEFRDGLQRIWALAVAGGLDAGHFHAMLLRQVRPGLRPLLDEVAAGRRDAVLATCASACYALPLARGLGFRHVIAAADGDGAGDGEWKRQRVQAMLTRCGWQPRPQLLLTDSADDLPLMRDSAAVLWFGRERARQRLRPLGIPVLPCRDHDDVGQLIAGLGAQAARRCSTSS